MEIFKIIFILSVLFNFMVSYLYYRFVENKIPTLQFNVTLLVVSVLFSLLLTLIITVYFGIIAYITYIRSDRSFSNMLKDE